MEVLMTLKPKIQPYVIMLLAAAVVVIIAAVALSTMYPPYGEVVLIVGLLVILLLGLMILQQFYRRWYITYEITENDVISRYGVFAPDEDVVPIGEISNIKIDRSFLGIMLGFGDIYLDTPSAKLDYEICMKDIDSTELNKAVELIRKLIEESRPARMMKRRSEQEAK